VNLTITPLRTVTMAVLAALLAGCGGGDEAELRAWMDETRKTMRPTTEPVPEPKQFSPYVYEGKSLIDPFDPQKMILAVARQAQARASASASGCSAPVVSMPLPMIMSRHTVISASLPNPSSRLPVSSRSPMPTPTVARSALRSHSTPRETYDR